MRETGTMGTLEQREILAGEILTLEKIREMEPRIDRLFHLACMIGNKHGQSFCANAVWYTLFKPRLYEIVGWGRKSEDLLETCTAWDIAYSGIYDQLPRCNGCACA